MLHQAHIRRPDILLIAAMRGGAYAAADSHDVRLDPLRELETRQRDESAKGANAGRRVLMCPNPLSYCFYCGCG